MGDIEKSVWIITVWHLEACGFNIFPNYLQRLSADDTTFLIVGNELMNTPFRAIQS